MKDDNQDLTELLQNDAHRIRESEEFDFILHQDTMRRIRLEEPGENRERGFYWSPLKVSATAAIAVIAAVLVFRFDEPPAQPETKSGQEIAQVADPEPSSVLSYRNAFAEGEDVLLAMLDQEARVVLPRSAAVFESNR